MKWKDDFVTDNHLTARSEFVVLSSLKCDACGYEALYYEALVDFKVASGWVNPKPDEQETDT